MQSPSCPASRTAHLPVCLSVCLIVTSVPVCLFVCAAVLSQTECGTERGCFSTTTLGRCIVFLFFLSSDSFNVKQREIFMCWPVPQYIHACGPAQHCPMESQKFQIQIQFEIKVEQPPLYDEKCPRFQLGSIHWYWLGICESMYTLTHTSCKYVQTYVCVCVCVVHMLTFFGRTSKGSVRDRSTWVLH